MIPVKFIFVFFYCVCAHYCIIVKPFNYNLTYKTDEYKKRDLLLGTFISDLYKNNYTKKYVLVNNDFLFNKCRKRKWAEVKNTYLKLEKFNIRHDVCVMNRILYITIEFIKIVIDSRCLKKGIIISNNVLNTDRYITRSKVLVRLLFKHIICRQFISSKFLLVVNIKYISKNISITPIKFNYLLLILEICTNRQKIKCLEYRLYNRIKNNTIKLNFLSKPYCL